MKKLFFAAAVAALLSTPTLAEDIQLGPLTITGAFARASAGMSKVGGGFMTIMNEGNVDKLIAVSADISERAELHTHIMDGDVMRMREVDHIDVPSGGKVELKPGGYHVMFIGLKHPLKEGESVPVELNFEKAGKVTVEIKVGPVGAKSPTDHSHGSHSHKSHTHTSHDKQ